VLNPFENISSPPTLEDILSGEGKYQILHFKLQCLANRVTTGMLQGDTLFRFIAEDDEFVTFYDHSSFEPFILFASREDEHALMDSVARCGLMKALGLKGINFTGGVGTKLEFSDDDSSQILLTMMNLGDIDPENSKD
jgi:hypothetical protein